MHPSVSDPEGGGPVPHVGSEVPEVVAAIDVGTNSVHMIVARSGSAGRFEVLTRHKESVRLGSGVGDMKELTPDAIDRGVAALGRCAEIARGFDATVWAVATSAVREATNALEFTHRASAEAGVVVRVISGVEEARLIQLGVLQALPLFDRSMLLVDVGGGSTEVLIGQGTDVRFARSHKLGAIRMTRAFFAGDGPLDDEAVDRCRSFIRARLAAGAHEAAPFAHEVSVAASGTAETLFAMSIARRGEEMPADMNGQVMTRKALRKVVADLVGARTVAERAELPGIDRSRVDIIVGGALVLEGVCDAFDVGSLTFSSYALREGVLLDAFSRLKASPGLGHLSDLRRDSVMHLLEVCDEDPEHAVRVAGHALALFDLLGERVGLDEDDRELLEAGALLANVGLFISHSAHHKHSYYVIRNAEHLTGFTDDEKELIAQVARYHRKSRPSEAKHPEFAALSERDRDRVSAMAALLRVAIALDRNHDGGVQDVSLAPLVDGPEGDPGVVELVLHPANGRDLGLELFSAADRSVLLEERLGVPVHFRAG
ncbi:MAG: exopolyphosphatase [Microthrixaceae bacterium]